MLDFASIGAKMPQSAGISRSGTIYSHSEYPFFKLGSLPLTLKY